MALDLGTLVAYIKLDTSGFDNGLGRSESRMGRFGSNVAKVAKVAGAATLAGIGAAAVGGVKAFSDFERGMNEVFTLMPGVSEKAMGKMSGQVKDFSTEFGVLPNDVVPALYQSLSAGVPPGNVFDFLETAQKAAKGGVTDLTTAVDGISSVTNAYGEDVVSATKASDLMFKAVAVGKTNFEELSGSLYNVIPTASALGVEFGDVTAALGAMTKQGVPTSVATTQLRQLFVELSKSGSKTSETFKEVAGVGFKQFVAGGGNVQDALKLLEGHAKKSGVGINDLFGSVEAGSAALFLTGKGAEHFSGALAEMANSAGATEAAYQRMDQGVGASWDKIKAAGQVALINIGESLAPLVAKFATFAEVALPAVANAMAALPAAFDAVTAAGAKVQELWSRFGTAITVTAGLIAAVFIPHLVALGVQQTITAAKSAAAWVTTQAGAIKAAAVHSATVVKMVAGWVLMGVQAMAQAARMAAAWLVALGPVGWAIAAVVAVAAAVVLNWDKIKAATAAAWSWVSSKTVAAWNAIKGAVSAAVNAIKGAVTTAWNAIKSAVATVMGAIKSTITAGWNAAKAAVTGAVNGIKAGVSSAFSAARSLVTDAMGAIKSAVTGRIGDVVGLFRGLVGKITGALSGAVSALFGMGQNIVGGLINGIKSMAGAVVSALVGLLPAPLRKFADKLGLASPSKLFRQYGEWTGEGYVLGLQDMQRPVESAVASLAVVPPRLGSASTHVRGRAAGATAAGPMSGSGVLAELKRLNDGQERLAQTIARLPRQYRMAERTA